MAMTLEQVREKVYAIRTQFEAHRKGLHGSWDDWAQEIVHDLSTAITELDHLSAQAKVRVTNFDTTYHGVMVRKMTEMLSNNEWADLFMADEALEALHAGITRLVAEKNTARLSHGA